VRHAKSSWKEILPDEDRPLAGRGERDAPQMGKLLAERDVHPDLILSSPARRALDTARILAKNLGYKRKRIAIDDRLYPGSALRLMQVIRGLEDRLASVMLFAHNPGLETLAQHFSKDIERMPTCAVAEFRFATEHWSQLDRLTPHRVTFDSPKKSIKA
jgi:phosphohistidine phosphatase